MKSLPGGIKLSIKVLDLPLVAAQMVCVGRK